MDAGPFARLFRVRRGVLPVVLALAMAGCSTTDFSEPVNDFAAATANAKTALSDLNTQVTDAYRGVLDEAILKGDVQLKPRRGECLTSSERCQLIIVDMSGAELEPYPPQPPLTRMTLLMGEIDRYAANLKALLEADTAQKVETQVNAALGSIQNLATTVSKLKAEEGAPPAEVPQFATPTGEAVNWVLGKYIERVKYRGLQRATAAAKPVIRDAANLFTATSEIIADVPNTTFAQEVTTGQAAMLTSRSQSAITSLAQSAARYDALLTAGPSTVFQSMGDAHDALADSLNNEEFNLATAIAKIEAFAAEAEQLAKILRELRAIVPENQEG
jgi:hypothetical protein